MGCTIRKSLVENFLDWRWSRLLVDESVDYCWSNHTGICSIPWNLCFALRRVDFGLLHRREVALGDVDFRAPENLGEFDLLKTRQNRLKLGSERRTFKKSNASGNVDVVEGSQE